MKISLFLILFVIMSCTSDGKKLQKDVHPEMCKGHLVPRPGYEGFLTHQNNYYHIKKYKIDQSFLDKAQICKIICSVAGQRYRVCHDRLGVCRRECKMVKKWWQVRKREKCKVNFLSFIDNYQTLIDANTRCYSQNKI